MAEFCSGEPAARDPLLHAIAADLHLWVPGFRRIAEGLLAEESRIDLFGVDERGAAVIVSVGTRADALARLGRLLAQRSWLAPRLADWLKLAPDLGVRLDLPILGVLACPAYGPETRAAAEALGAEWLRLVRYRNHRHGAGIDMVLEPVGAPTTPGPEPTGSRNDAPAEPPARFRTGLSEADLELTAAERSEFE